MEMNTSNDVLLESASELDISKVVNTKDLMKIAKELEANTFLKLLKLTLAVSDNDGLTALAKALMENTTLRIFKLEFDSQQDGGVENVSLVEIANALVINRGLASFTLAGSVKVNHETAISVNFNKVEYGVMNCISIDEFKIIMFY